MKKLLSVLLALVMAISLCACASSTNDDGENNESNLEETDAPNSAENPSDTDEPNTEAPADNPSTPASNPQSEAPKTEKHTHSYKSSVSKEATCEQSGQMRYVCSCGDSYTESIAVLGHNFSNGICSRCGTDITSLCSVSSINCPDQLTYHYKNSAGIEINTHPIRSLSVSNVYFESRGNDVVLHLTLTGTVSSNVADGDGFGYVVLGGNGSGRILIPAGSSKSYSHNFEFTGITPGVYTISVEDFYHNS